MEPLYPGQGHLLLEQIEQFQGWGVHNFSGQLVPVNYIYNVIINLASTLHVLLALT